MEKAKTSVDKKTHNIFKNPWYTLIICLFLAMLFLVVTHFIPKDKNENIVEFSSVNRICELATLRCYFHNVGEKIVEPDALFEHGLFKYGYKKIWIEYEGIVTIGVDASKVIIENPNEKGIVRVYVPEAEVLDVDANFESMGDPITETGMFTTITAKEQAEIYSEEQKNMKEQITQDKSILNQARDNAKIILKNYIKNIGKMTGKEYTVDWIESIGTNISTSEQTTS